MLRRASPPAAGAHRVRQGARAVPLSQHPRSPQGRRHALPLSRRPRVRGSAAAAAGRRPHRHDDRPAPRGRARRGRRARRRAAAPRPPRDQPAAGLTAEAREVIPLLYENPELVWLGFKDPSFPLPKVIENLFPHRESHPRHRRAIGCATSSRSARPQVRPRLQSLGSSTSTSPASTPCGCAGCSRRSKARTIPPTRAPRYRAAAPGDARRTTSRSRTSISTSDIGGYAKVKKRLRAEILDVLAARTQLDRAGRRSTRLEELIPRGMIFWGPPGTGKTLFAKAMATALGAAVTIVSGPELKSKWVGESEENLRADLPRGPAVGAERSSSSTSSTRSPPRAAPTPAPASSTRWSTSCSPRWTASTRRNSSSSSAPRTSSSRSTRPCCARAASSSRSTFPYPDADDRREILGVYDQRIGLEMTPSRARLRGQAHRRARARAERRHALLRRPSPGAVPPARAHAAARETATGRRRPPTIERAIEQWLDRPKLTTAEERVVATHEAGHAVCALFCEHAPPIDRISIRGDIGGALGFVQHADAAHRYVVTYAQLLDTICTMFGGREAEALLLDDLSIGSAATSQSATAIARALVEQYGDEVPRSASRSGRTTTSAGLRARAIADRSGDPGHRRDRTRPRTRDSDREARVIDRAPRSVARAQGPRPRVVRASGDAWLTSSSDSRRSGDRQAELVIDYASDSDALPIEHEDEHRRLASKVSTAGSRTPRSRSPARREPGVTEAPAAETPVATPTATKRQAHGARLRRSRRAPGRDTTGLARARSPLARRVSPSAPRLVVPSRPTSRCPPQVLAKLRAAGVARCSRCRPRRVPIRCWAEAIQPVAAAIPKAPVAGRVRHRARRRSDRRRGGAGPARSPTVGAPRRAAIASACSR